MRDGRSPGRTLRRVRAPARDPKHARLGASPSASAASDPAYPRYPRLPGPPPRVRGSRRAAARFQTRFPLIAAAVARESRLRHGCRVSDETRRPRNSVRGLLAQRKALCVAGAQQFGQLRASPWQASPPSAVFGDAYHSSTNGPIAAASTDVALLQRAPGAEREGHVELRVLDHRDLVVARLEDLVEGVLDLLLVGRREVVGPADPRRRARAGAPPRRGAAVRCRSDRPAAGSGWGRRRPAGWSDSPRR